MALGNSSGEQLATAVDGRLKADDETGAPSPWLEVELQYGRRQLEENTTYFRVCWVPIGGSIEQTMYAGGRTRAADRSAMQIRTDVLEHDIFVHGSNFETTEALKRAMVAALVQCASGSIAFADWEWITETQAHDWTVDGSMIRMRVGVQLPIHDSDRVTAEVLTTSWTGTFQGQSGDTDVCG